MAYECKNGFYIKDGCYIVPIHPNGLYADSYELIDDVLKDKIGQYNKKPPLLAPVMRGGSAVFLPVSGELRKRLQKNGKIDLDYVPIKASRYKPGEINVESEVNIDMNDIGQALELLKQYDEVIIIEDIFDRGKTVREIKRLLAISRKNILTITPYVKPEANETDMEPDYSVQPFFRKVIDGKNYPPWVAFGHETDDFVGEDEELWKEMFPEFRRQPK
ncbi:MAG: phosphoribosyltransferase [Candidatus Aenigmarchaeota archaeon]|nr:phosphoribosyltransferase [Candidatus Aenigmarchaeota archaeon]